MVRGAGSSLMVAFDRHAYLISDRQLNRRLILGRDCMQKIDKVAHAAKVVALCLPPVVRALIGLAALSRKKGGVDPASRRQTANTDAAHDVSHQRMMPGTDGRSAAF
jgi:hypothetical protein